MLLLSDEQMVKVMWDKAQSMSESELANIEQADRFRFIAKAQLIADWEWLNGRCTEHEHYVDVTEVSMCKVFTHRYLCPECRAEAAQEINKLKEGEE